MAQSIEYTGKEWNELLKGFSQKQLRNTLKRSYRKVGQSARKVAVAKLHASGLSVKGNQSDWDKGIRLHIYSKGGGFLITVKERHGKQEKSMHTNRKGFKKPILMWAEDGTEMRYAKPTKWHYVWSGSYKLASRHGGAYRPRKKRVADAGLKRGQMPKKEFLQQAEPGMFRVVETDLGKELETATVKVAKKCGFI